ncbi:nucleotidyl transferase AbiEii/AbiGii toxin family protein [Candidatus Woesearchaeota archaeon]|nr:nucleotidyl transferase AbiEii/AbiGii toxin family protein [Candidatus Woesearchaeota archaeon]
MISLNELKRIAAKQRIALSVVEKDYALTWVLYGLSKTEFKKYFVFKGGTAIRKIYFPDWRYSEDLDFTLPKKFNDEELREVIDKINIFLTEMAGITLNIKSLHSNPEYAQIKIQFLGPLNNKNTIKLDLSFNEPIILTPKNKDIHSEYSDKEKRSLLVYPLEEILAEKIRSILQRAKTRDYYDVWKILKLHHDKINVDLLYEVLIKKCQAKKLDFNKDNLFSSERIKPAQEYWEKSLAHQVNAVPDFQTVVNESKSLINKFLKI